MTEKGKDLRKAREEALQRKRDLHLIKCGVWMFIYFIICLGVLFIVKWLA